MRGRRAFRGEDVSETLAAVIKFDPNWDLVPADVPGYACQALRVRAASGAFPAVGITVVWKW
jgi:hypothetical protein